MHYNKKTYYLQSKFVGKPKISYVIQCYLRITYGQKFVDKTVIANDTCGFICR